MAKGKEPMVGVDLGAAGDLPLGDLAVRFVFGAAISTIAGVVSVLAGSEPGGILLAFPAILPATLTLIEKEESERQAEGLADGAILGSAALAAFAVLVWQCISSNSAPVILALATLAWLTAAVLLYLGLRMLRSAKGHLHNGLGELGKNTKVPRR